jgi:hypothetical protein
MSRSICSCIAKDWIHILLNSSLQVLHSGAVGAVDTANLLAVSIFKAFTMLVREMDFETKKLFSWGWLESKEQEKCIRNKSHNALKKPSF